MSQLTPLLQHYSLASSLKQWLNYSAEDITTGIKKYETRARLAIGSLVVALPALGIEVFMNAPDLLTFITLVSIMGLVPFIGETVSTIDDYAPISETPLCKQFLELKQQHPIVQEYVQHVTNNRQLCRQDYYTCVAIVRLQEQLEQQEICKQLHNIP